MRQSTVAAVVSVSPVQTLEYRAMILAVARTHAAMEECALPRVDIHGKSPLPLGTAMDGEADPREKDSGNACKQDVSVAYHFQEKVEV